MKEIIEKLKKKNKTIATMESCTGGYIANEITNIEGASSVLKYSAITYSNEYKIKMGVSNKVIEEYTVYSIETAKEMSRAISEFANSDYGIGITGKLNCQDKKNPYNDKDTAYISIYDSQSNEYYLSTIKTTSQKRVDNKKLIHNEVLRMLKELL